MPDPDIHKDSDFICFSLDMLCVFLRSILYSSLDDTGYLHKGTGSLREQRSGFTEI